MPVGNVLSDLAPATAALVAVLCAASVTPLAGQQSAEAAVKASAADTVLPGPRLPARVQSVEPMEMRASTQETAETALLAAQGGQHTIVISTLVLVLAVVIIVLLI